MAIFVKTAIFINFAIGHHWMPNIATEGGRTLESDRKSLPSFLTYFLAQKISTKASMEMLFYIENFDTILLYSAHI